MIESLDIHDFFIIDRAHIPLEPGLSVITGETGAGKSMIISAINLLAGRQNKPLAARDGAQSAGLALTVNLADAPEARAWIRSNLPDLADAGRVTLQRDAPGGGRAKARVNDCGVTLKQLAELTNVIVEICGQNSHQALMQTERHLDILDNHCGHTDAVARLAETARRWRATHKQLEETRAQVAASNAQRTLLEYQISELDELAVDENEWETLDVEHRTLSRGEQLTQTCGHAVDLLDADETGIQTALGRIVRDFEQFDARPLQGVKKQLEEALVVLQSANSDLRALLESADWSEQRLHEVEARLTRLSEVARKNNVAPADLHRHHQKLRDELKRITQSESSLEELEGEEARLADEWRATAEKISEKRRKTARALEKDVVRMLGSLAMPDAVFRTRFTPVGEEDAPVVPNARGLERAVFEVQTNPGGRPAPLNAVASGGEVSRISLALRAVIAEKYPVPTLIFDEVDVGIGGATAETVGALLKRMSGHSQVLCITHLPQVASQAGHHYRVEKRTAAKSARISLTKLERPQRDREIARMMAGGEITENSLAHASELLNRHEQSGRKTA